jgi:hypothetical protein
LRPQAHDHVDQHRRVGADQRGLAAATAPDEVLAIEKQLDPAEQYMNASGIYTADQIREVNELRMRARWKLGQLLARVERGQGLRTSVQAGSKSFIGYIDELGLPKSDALRAQRIGALPPLSVAPAIESVTLRRGPPCRAVGRR